MKLIRWIVFLLFTTPSWNALAQVSASSVAVKHVEGGRALSNEEAWDEATLEFAAAVEKDLCYADAYFYRAQVYFHMGTA